MELLIPRTVRSIIDRGRKAERKRFLAAYREARARGIDLNSAESEEFLLNFEPDEPRDTR